MITAVYLYLPEVDDGSGFEVTTRDMNSLPPIFLSERLANRHAECHYATLPDSFPQILFLMLNLHNCCTKTEGMC